MSTQDSTRPCILLAEDEAMIALELADGLEQEGFAVAGPFATCAEAERWLKAHRPAAAILDNELKDGPCEALALDLKRRGVPFLVHSGHRGPDEAAGAFADVPWIVKPAPTERLIEALRDSCGLRRDPA